MAALGLIGSVALLIFLALRGINIVFSAVLCSLLVILSNQLPLAEGLTDYYSFGPLGAFTFAGKFFLLFVGGAMFGRVMGESHAAASIALALVRKLGAHRVLWITTMACALLTYGGVVVFVVIFAVYPLGLKLLQEADVPKRLFCGALALGAGTFTLTALPGTPSIHNVISSVALGTDLFAGALLGILGGIIMFGSGIWYLERERLKAQAAGEHFVAAPSDRISEVNDEEYPAWQIAILPLAAVLFTIVAPRVITMMVSSEQLTQDAVPFAILRFATTEPIVWPSIALFGGTALSVLLFANLRRHALHVIGSGSQDAILPLINTAAVIGYGSVVTHTEGFAQFASALLESDLPALVSSFLAVSVVSAITGSASGGLQIFMQTMAPSYIELGMNPEVLHRLATMAAGCFDSLPHGGAIIAMLTITGLTHKEAYRDVFVITVAVPTLATLSMMALVAVTS